MRETHWCPQGTCHTDSNLIHSACYNFLKIYFLAIFIFISLFFKHLSQSHSLPSVLFHSKKHNKLLVRTGILPDSVLPDQLGMSAEFSMLFIYYLVEHIFTKCSIVPQRVSEAGKIQN